MVDKKIEQDLWEELKLLQPIIDKFDKIAAQTKTWFITTFVALTGFILVQEKHHLLWLNFVLTVAFYIAEVSHRTAHGAFLTRTRNIEEILRDPSKFTDDEKSPHLDKHLSHGKHEWYALARQAVEVLLQPRVSGICWLAIIMTIFLQLSLLGVYHLEVNMNGLNLVGLSLNFVGAMLLLISNPVQTGIPPVWASRTGIALLALGFFLQLINGFRLLLQ